MPFSPSNFEWYVWLGFAIIAAIVCGFSWKFITQTTDATTGGGWVIVLLISGLVGISSLLIGIIRFVKRAWGG
jgi:hypothetical protein